LLAKKRGTAKKKFRARVPCVKGAPIGELRKRGRNVGPLQGNKTRSKDGMRGPERQHHEKEENRKQENVNPREQNFGDIRITSRAPNQKKREEQRGRKEKKRLR